MTFLEDANIRVKIEQGREFLVESRESFETIDKDPRAFWKKHLENKRKRFIIVEPFDDRRIEPASYILSLGDQYYATSEKLPKNLRSESTPSYVRIEPGEFAVLTTGEYLYVPAHLVGLISVKNR